MFLDGAPHWDMNDMTLERGIAYDRQVWNAGGYCSVIPEADEACKGLYDGYRLQADLHMRHELQNP